MKKIEMDVQGHRGCRGLLPENTLPAFQRALELGVNTLEMDLVISADDQVVVSHEPYFRAGIGLTPDGKEITKEEEKSYNIYQMSYDKVRSFVIGTVPDSKHPQRENIKTYKPKFSQVVKQAQDYSRTFRKELPFFNIEIKRSKTGDSIYHPKVEKYVDLVLAEVRQLFIEDAVIIQSFDLEALRFTKSKMPKLPIALLIGNTKSPQENIQELGFKPDIYSSYFKLLKTEDILYLKEANIKIIPWTVNTEADIKSMIALKVDGIISDYPDRVIKLVR